MSIKPIFLLANEQRKYIGLSPIDDNWDVVQLNDIIYLYFEGDILRKSISASEKYYKENELNRITSENRTMLPPLTERGKPKKLNYTGFQSINPQGVYFCWAGSDGDIQIANYTTQQTFYTSYGSGKKYQSWDAVQDWLSDWTADTTEQDLVELEQFRAAKRKNVKLKEGDFFTFKIGRRDYGFGRILMDIRAIKKGVKSGKIEEKHYGLTRLMTQPLMIQVYQKISDSPVADLQELTQTPVFLSQQIMDNRLFYGECPVIGHLPLKPEELDFPISIDQYGPSKLGNRGIYLQYGMIFLTVPFEDFSAYCNSLRESGLPVKKTGGYACNAIGAGILAMQDIPAMKQAIQTGSFLEQSVLSFVKTDISKTERLSDLRHPALREVKNAMFAYFGLDGNKSYAENLEIYVAIKQQ